MRFVLLLLGAATAWAAGAGTLLAADAVVWPQSDVPFEHGPGYYLSLWKMAPIWLLFATWVYSTDWVNRDTLALRLDYAFWNSVVTFPFFASFVLAWLIQLVLALGFPLLLVAYVVPLGLYVRERNSKVGLGEQVLTRRHLRKWFAGEAGPDAADKARGRGTAGTGRAVQGHRGGNRQRQQRQSVDGDVKISVFCRRGN